LGFDNLAVRRLAKNWPIAVMNWHESIPKTHQQSFRAERKKCFACARGHSVSLETLNDFMGYLKGNYKEQAYVVYWNIFEL
jgi:hypothetical protein